MLRFAEPLNVTGVATYLGMVLRLVAGLFVVPLAISVGFRELEFTVSFGAVIVGTAIVGWLLGRKRPSRLGRREAIVVTALAYPVFALLGALALLPRIDYLDGLFETMSGVTTTGLSVLSLVNTPHTVLYFRAYTQWIGGAGIIVLSVVVLLGGSRSALGLVTSESKEDNIAGSIVDTAIVILRIYAGLTAIGAVVLFLAGMSVNDAILHALATISTGGFSPYADSIGHFNSVPIMVVLTVLMLGSAVSLPLYYGAYRHGLRWFLRDSQLRGLLVFAGLGALVFALAAPVEPRAVVAAVFNAVSAITTTGYSVGDPAKWPVVAFGLALALMVMGGSMGSTAGGVKQYRVGVVLKSIGRTAARPNLPEHAQVPLSYNGEIVTDAEINDVVGVLGLFGILASVSALLFALGGASVAHSLFEAASALGTVGLTSGITAPNAAAWVKGILIVDMWAGRLEMIPIAVLLVNAGLLVRGRKP